MNWFVRLLTFPWRRLQEQLLVRRLARRLAEVRASGVPIPVVGTKGRPGG
jgi:hypothetical protein